MRSRSGETVGSRSKPGRPPDRSAPEHETAASAAAARREDLRGVPALCNARASSTNGSLLHVNSRMDAAPELSVVIPAYNERDNLAPLLAELRAALDSSGRGWEIVLVDDASTDGSAELLAAEARADPRLRPLYLAERIGQSGALAAGLERARGAIVVTLDADLQNDPADLPRVLAAL